MTDQIKDIIFNIIKEYKEVNILDIKLEKIQNEKFGDYSSNILMVCKLNSNQKDEIISKLLENNYVQENIKKIEYKEPGFLNFFLKEEVLIKNLEEIVNFNEKMFWLKNVKSFLIEHTSPNTNKPLHIGHLRNTVFAMSVIRILKSLNNTVVADCLFNDRGIHICKAMFGYLKKDHLDSPIEVVTDEWFNNQDKWPLPEEGEHKDSFVGKYYVLGVQYEKEEKFKNEMQWLLKEWENGNEKVRKVWEVLNNWFYDEFYNTFKLLNSKADHFWYESEFFEKAKDLALVGFKKGIFVKLEDGALLTQLQKYNLTDDIVQRSDGTAMYFTQDLYLTKMKTEKFPSDEYIWVVGPEQKLHMKQVFAVCEQMGIGQMNKFKHLSYGAVCKKDGSKMSSRSGDVLSILDLLAELKQTVLEKKDNEYKSLNNFSELEQEKIAEKIGIGAIKYAILKLEKEQDLHFDLDEILDLKGNGSPYIQYTYARCFSIIEKAGEVKEDLKISEITEEEKTLLRDLIYLKETAEKAGSNFAPHFIANYLFELARDFSNFYEKNRILDAEVNKELKIKLTKSVANVLKWGLGLLGIEVMDKL